MYSKQPSERTHVRCRRNAANREKPEIREERRLFMDFEDRNVYKDYSGIYAIRNKITNSVYVGQTRQKFIKRYFLHSYKLRHRVHDNRHLQHAFDKYGSEAFVFEVVEILLGDKEFFNQREMYYIQLFRHQTKCYNMTDGGDGAKGTHPSHENIRRLAEINRKKNTGKKLTEETKRKMSEAQKYRHQQYPMTDDMKRKIIDGRRNGLESGTYQTQKITPDTVKRIKHMLMQGIKQSDIAKEFGITQTNVSAIKTEKSWRFVSIEGWDEWRKMRHRSTLCQAGEPEGATTIP